MADYFEGLTLRSEINSSGLLTLFLREEKIPSPQDDEIVVRIEAAPINPADCLVMLPGVDLTTLQTTRINGLPAVTGRVALSQLKSLTPRLNVPINVGNEGAGTVVAAGRHVSNLLGRVVAVRDAMYAQYRKVRVADCLLLPENTPAKQGAAALINPMTVLCMLETLRREGHTGLVHTAAASNLGQMLQRVCHQENIPLVNIVRSEQQATLLKAIGAQHVINSTAANFDGDLVAALQQTGATLAFDAIGGGTLSGTLLTCMEQALKTKNAFSRYGSARHKQIYIYGVLDNSPRIFSGDYGAAWGVGGWLMSQCLATLDEDRLWKMKERVSGELTTTFACHYAKEISLETMLDIHEITIYCSHMTGNKYLVTPHA